MEYQGRRKTRKEEDKCVSNQIRLGHHTRRADVRMRWGHGVVHTSRLRSSHSRVIFLLGMRGQRLDEHRRARKADEWHEQGVGVNNKNKWHGVQPTSSVDEIFGRWRRRSSSSESAATM